MIDKESIAYQLEQMYWAYPGNSRLNRILEKVYQKLVDAEMPLPF